MWPRLNWLTCFIKNGPSSGKQTYRVNMLTSNHRNVCTLVNAGTELREMDWRSQNGSIDHWREKQDDDPRPEAIRRLVELGLKVKSK